MKKGGIHRERLGAHTEERMKRTGVLYIATIFLNDKISKYNIYLQINHFIFHLNAQTKKRRSIQAFDFLQ